MHDTIHVDEKYFYLDQVDKSFIVVLEREKLPHSTCNKDKQCINTIMFATAAARPPAFDNGKNQWFNGMLGTWPAIQQTGESSKN